MKETKHVPSIEAVPNRVMDTYKRGGDYILVFREEGARVRGAFAEIARRRAAEQRAAAEAGRK